MVMRPKSRATVVFVLPSTPVTSSTPTLACVSTSSVVSCGISLTETTSVVLPVPNPPATTILTDLRSTYLSPPRSQSLETGQHHLQQPAIADLLLRGGADAQVSLVQEHVHHHLRDGEWEVQVGADLGDGDPVGAPD